MMQRFLALLAMSTVLPSARDGTRRKATGVRPERSLLILSLGVATACSSSLSAAPTYPAAEDGFVSTEIANPLGLPHDTPPPHAILPGDVLYLRVLSAEPHEPVELWVDAAGRVHVPFAGDVDVMGLDLGEAEGRIQNAIRRYDRFAQVTLAIRTFSGHRVTLTGAVDKPGVYEARPGARVADIIASAGGTRVILGDSEATEAADVDGARIVRDGKTLPVSIKRALFGEPSHNVYVRAGDVIFIPWMAGRQIPVLGDVRTARNVPFHDGLRLTEALAAAGGTTRTADTADIRIVRGPLSRAKVYRANLKDVLAGTTTDVVLAPGDVVFVTEHWFATATEVINRLTPLLATAAVYSTLSR